MLSLSLTALLVVWTVTAVRYVSVLRNTEPQLVGAQMSEPTSHPLAA